MSNKIAFVVEDEPTYQFIIANHLRKKYGFDVRCFSNGDKCLEHLTENPSVIVLDYFLEDGSSSILNGLDLFKIIKRMSLNTKVVMMTAQDDVEVFLEMLKNGVRDYVIKNEQSLTELDECFQGLFEATEAA
ncbi:MAG: response regulator [Cytophagales bacterium]